MTLTESEEKTLDALMDKIFDLEFEIAEKIKTLIDAKWDAPTLMKDIEADIKQRDKIFEEAIPLHEKADYDKKEDENSK